MPALSARQPPPNAWPQRVPACQTVQADGSQSSASSPLLRHAREAPAAAQAHGQGLRHEAPHQGPHLPDLGLVPTLSGHCGPRFLFR